MRHLLLSFFVIAGLAACDSANQDTVGQSAEGQAAESNTADTKSLSETEKLNEWFEVKYEEEIMMSPIGLTFLGRKERYGEIDDMSVAAEDKQLAWKKKSVEEMQAKFDYVLLSDDAKISYDLWKYQYEEAAAGVEFRSNDYIFNQMQGAHTFFPTLMVSFHKVEELSDMQAYNSRLSQIGRGMNQLVERTKQNVEAGTRAPRFAYDFVIKETLGVIEGAPFDDNDKDSTLWADAKAKVADLQAKEIISEEQADGLLAQAKTALINDFKPAYQSLADFMSADIENTSEQSMGVSALPNGEAYYAHQLKWITTTDLSADEIHQVGLEEVARLRAEMETIKEKVGFDGTLQEFFVEIRDSKDNEKFYYPNTDEGRQGYLDDATAAIDNIKAQLPDYFGILPKADLVVKRVEAFREQDGAAQHYYSGTPDGSRPGIYYAHLSDMSTMPKNELEVIAYHEGLPGHHMQISIAQELEAVPTFRTQAGFGAYVEGWALYSEKLAKEMPSTFTDPHSDFGRLGSEIWRAIRLVVDTGMHVKGWSEQKAIDFFSANSPAPLETIRSEIRRYFVIPGQATSYKVGMMDIQRLRKLAEDELGDKFDIRGFHDTVLGGGALPLSMLDRRVRQWIDSVKAS